MESPTDKISAWIDSHRTEIIETYEDILRVPALAPKNGGNGEWAKAHKIIEIITAWGWKDWLKVIEIPDEEAQNGSRPNLIITYNPKNLQKPKIISVAHMDVVPVGDISHWDHDPFDPVIKGGKLFARGAEDNGQGLICSLYGLKCIADLKLPVSNPVQVILVADEELGSAYGIRPLVQQNIFSPEDLVIVPDAGVANGLELEVAEKSAFRVQIVVEGRQGHAARPADALNTQPIANALATNLYDLLHARFIEENPLFIPPVSTFEPTKRFNNVANVNTLPGRDEQWWDCRLIPETDINSLQHIFKSLAQEFAQSSGAKISVDFKHSGQVQLEIDQQTPVVARFQRAVNTQIDGELKLVGIGGGTCAAYFRNAGMPAIVWGHMDHTAHQTNEYCVVDNLYTDTAIFAAFFMDQDTLG